MPGILFLCLSGVAAGQSLDLAADLIAEGHWVGARREALRVLIEQPNNERALLLAAQAQRHVDPARTNAVIVLDHLAQEAGDAEVRAQAGYEVGRARWAEGDLSAAWATYARVFQSAGERELFLRSGCALFLLRQQQSDLGADNPALLTQLASCRNLWSWELRDEVRVGGPGERTRLTAKPGEWIVRFYRTQIGPAIGHRCSLHPSCSSYFLEASRAHGLLGVPLIADRLVREPGVVAAGQHPIRRGEETRFHDPLQDHVRSETGKGSVP